MSQNEKPQSCLLEQYLDFLEDTEPPQQFHRWAFLSCIGAQLSRNIFFVHGHNKIYPNMYTMLVGAPATRKSTSIKISKSILSDAGYTQFSFGKSSKQKFLIDWGAGFLCTMATKEETMDAMLDAPLNAVTGGSATARKQITHISDCFIAQDEFIDFIGQGNFDFISLLTTLWDNLDKYDERLKNSDSVSIPNPTLSVLGGITPSSLAMALPAEANGSGFLSRVLLVYSEPSGKKIAFPAPPDNRARKKFVNALARLRSLEGECTLSQDSRELLTKIYHTWENISDVKLEYYAGRRLTHLLKLCMICAALRHSLSITTEDIIKANTILCYTESGMSMALQHFGTAKNLESSTKVLDFVNKAGHPVSLREVFSATRTYFDKLPDLMLVCNNLMESGKVQFKDGLIYPLMHQLIDMGDLTDFRKYIREYKGGKKVERIKLVD